MSTGNPVHVEALDPRLQVPIAFGSWFPSLQEMPGIAYLDDVGEAIALLVARHELEEVVPHLLRDKAAAPHIKTQSNIATRAPPTLAKAITGYAQYFKPRLATMHAVTMPTCRHRGATATRTPPPAASTRSTPRTYTHHRNHVHRN
jgi:hypothetical protein